MDMSLVRDTIKEALQQTLFEGLMRIEGGWATIEECQKEAKELQIVVNIMYKLELGQLDLIERTPT